ncbi:molybdopterin-guanine dinucleotide biosynthesis protein MobB, partial [Pasteurella multocida]|nr:molybdopterin-guanine dinucleotide biosynthesis protein MobB [Pasteurella multocida]
ELDQYVIALATNYPLSSTVPVLDINDITQIATFIRHWYQQKCGAK